MLPEHKSQVSQLEPSCSVRRREIRGKFNRRNKGSKGVQKKKETKNMKGKEKTVHSSTTLSL